MPRGGKRPNAGRRRGSLTTRTVEIAESAVEKGRSPFERMLRHLDFLDAEAENMRQPLRDLFSKLRDDGSNTNLRKDIREMMSVMEKAFAAAAVVAPYCHPRLSALAVYEPTNDVEVLKTQRIIDDIISKMKPKKKTDENDRSSPSG